MGLLQSSLPQKVLLSSFSTVKCFMDYLYDEVFTKDFINFRPCFANIRLGLKFHPIKNNRAYTFEHMTSSGPENLRNFERLRSERLPWCAYTINNVEKLNLKFWVQKRKGEYRICIWLNVDDDFDYFVILSVRKGFILPWTAFVANYKNTVEKKQKEYEEWRKRWGDRPCTPRDIVNEIFKKYNNS